MVRQFGAILVASGLVLATLAGTATLAAAGATAQSAEDPVRTEAGFVVAPNPDGSAEVSLIVTFDLTTDVRRQAFERLQNNQTVRTAFRDQFADRLRGVAESAASETGREMRITNPTVALSTSGETGVVVLSATWEGLASVENGRLVIAAPFDKGFEVDRPFVVEAPDGYEFAETSPAPTSQSDGVAEWTGRERLDGFNVVLVPTDTGAREDERTADGASSSTTGPGFAIGGTILALLAAVSLVARRQR